MYNLIFIATQTVLGSFVSLPSCENAMKQHAIFSITGPSVKATPEIERAAESIVKYSNKYQCLKVDNKPKM